MLLFAAIILCLCRRVSGAHLSAEECNRSFHRQHYRPGRYSFGAPGLMVGDACFVLGAAEEAGAERIKWHHSTKSTKSGCFAASSWQDEDAALKESSCHASKEEGRPADSQRAR